MIKAGIIGSTGYAGVELFRILLRHPGVEKIYQSSVSFEGQQIESVYQNLIGQLGDKSDGKLLTADEVVEKSDIIFTALPHGIAEQYADRCVKEGKKLIDLSADFRYGMDEETFKKWYKAEWKFPEVHKESVYGSPEMNREEIKKARVIGNPGCYVTSATLGLLPALKKGLITSGPVIVDSKSGVTGSGRNPTMSNQFCECGESFSAYKVGNHRHQSEIVRNCSILAGKDMDIIFTPHLLPQNRGILTTIYAPLTEEAQKSLGESAAAGGRSLVQEIHKIYEEALAQGTSPELLVSKKSSTKDGGTFSATIELGSNTVDMTLSFKCNKNLTVTVEGGSIGTNTGSGNDYVYAITGATGSLKITFTNGLTSNARLDNIKLSTGDSKKPAGLSWGTSSRTVTIGADDNVFPTLSNENNLTVTYNSSDETVATIAADGAITLLAAGETTISASSEETDEFEAGKAEYKLIVKAALDPNAKGQVNNPYTVAEALEVINALENGATTSDKFYVKGFVVGTPDIQKKDDGTFYGNANFDIADTKGGSDKLTCYRLKGLENANIDSEDYIKENDQLVVMGQFQKFVKDEVVTPEVKNGHIVSIETPHTITITNTEHGNITLDKYEAFAGEKVSVIGQTTDDGWDMDEPTITAENGEKVEIGGNDEEGHYIIMPASNVTIALNVSKLYTITPVFNSEQGDITGITFNSENNPIYKKAGKNIQFTVKAKEGFQIESVTAATADNSPITVNVAADNSYYEFQMPASDVTITATFSSTSGISNVNAENAKNAVRYNLAGQKVSNGYKGVVIENGKKVVLK